MPTQITTTTTVYTFKELLEDNPTAVDKARQWFSEGMWADGWWSEYVTDQWKEALEQIGFDGAEVRYSGFWCQGDGASFTCETVDMDKLTAFMSTDIEGKDRIEPSEETEPLEDFRPWLVNKLKSRMKANRKYRRLRDLYSAEIDVLGDNYVHEGTVGFEVIGEYSHEAKRVDLLANAFESEVEEMRRALCHAIYKDLEQEYYYQTSDEALLDACEANDYTFTASGEIYA